MFTYLGMRLISITHEGAWHYLNTPTGHWFMVEITILAIVPFLYYYGVMKKNVRLIQVTGVLTMIGIILNRFNLTLLTFNYQLPRGELFYWKEVLVVISVIIIQVLVYRWIVNRMPVLRDHPDYPNDGH
jgi:Ni/Fe-hydrogenase subunit HybB-like protein